METKVEEVAVKPKQGLYKTICPYCDARLMSGRSMAMRNGVNIGVSNCLKCGQQFAQRLVGEAQAMETCKIGSPLFDQWHNEAYKMEPASPHLEEVS